jgi:hypothetical protein
LIFRFQVASAPLDVRGGRYFYLSRDLRNHRERLPDGNANIVQGVTKILSVVDDCRWLSLAQKTRPLTATVDPTPATADGRLT